MPRRKADAAPAEKARVKTTRDMDAETFLKHFNARHAPIGGRKVFGKSTVPGDENEDLLREFHKRLHKHDPEGQNHTHRSVK